MEPVNTIVFSADNYAAVAFGSSSESAVTGQPVLVKVSSILSLDGSPIQFDGVTYSASRIGAFRVRVPGTSPAGI